MAEFHDLVEALGWLLTNKLQSRSEYTHGLLGNGQGQVQVPNRSDYSWVRPDRFSTRVFEVFNKRVSGPDGMPVLIGELPWQPELTQVIAVDWDAYIGVGWGDATPGILRHGEAHEWRDGAPSVDTFNVYRRQMAELKTQPVGSGSASVNVSAYNFTHFDDVVKSWHGQPGLDLSPAIPGTTGTARFVLTYWDPCSGTSGFLGVATGTIGVDTPATTLNRPAAPPGTIPSAWVRLAGGQNDITEFDIYDARPLWMPSLEFSTGSCGIWAGIIPIGDPGDNFTGTTVEAALEELAEDGGGGPPTGPAGGDLTGTYPDPLVAGLYGSPLLPAAPNEGDILMFTGSAWQPLPSPVVADAWGFVVKNSSGAFASPNDVGHIDENGEYQTTTTQFDDVAWCVVLVGGSNNDDISVARRGRVTVVLNGNNSIGDFLYTSATAGQGESQSFVRPELLAVALTANGAGAGGTCEALLLTGRASRSPTDANDLLRIFFSSSSNWLSTLNGAPAGAVITYNVPLTAGNEDAIVPNATTEICKTVLWNTSKSPDKSALIESVNAGANTITVNDAADIAGWSNGETITARSQTNTSVPIGTTYFFDTEIEDTSVIPALAVKIGFFAQWKDTAAANIAFFLHPFETHSAGKQVAYLTQVANVNVTANVEAVIQQRRFCLARRASGVGTNSLLLRTLSVVVAVP